MVWPGPNLLRQWHFHFRDLSVRARPPAVFQPGCDKDAIDRRMFFRPKLFRYEHRGLPRLPARLAAPAPHGTKATARLRCWCVHLPSFYSHRGDRCSRACAARAAAHVLCHSGVRAVDRGDDRAFDDAAGAASYWLIMNEDRAAGACGDVC